MRWLLLQDFLHDGQISLQRVVSFLGVTFLAAQARQPRLAFSSGVPQHAEVPHELRANFQLNLQVKKATIEEQEMCIGPNTRAPFDQCKKLARTSIKFVSAGFFTLANQKGGA